MLEVNNCAFVRTSNSDNKIMQILRKYIVCTSLMCLSLVKRVSHGVIVQNDRYRGHYMAAKRDEISLMVLKNIFAFSNMRRLRNLYLQMTMYFFVVI